MPEADMNYPDLAEPLSQEYGDVFSRRGHSYDQAMKASPRARDLEFQRLFDRSKPSADETILDIPSLGGYLTEACPWLGRVIPLDFALPIHPSVRQVAPTGDWPVEGADRLVCLAALHHVEDLGSFLRNACRHLRRGAHVHLADVDPTSMIATFLDGFVGAHTPTGHRGFYHEFRTFNYPKQLNLLGVEERECPWRFRDSSEMAMFCRKLFFLDGVSDQAILEAVDEMVGIRREKEAILMAWKLTYVELIIQ